MSEKCDQNVREKLALPEKCDGSTKINNVQKYVIRFSSSDSEVILFSNVMLMFYFISQRKTGFGLGKG